MLLALSCLLSFPVGALPNPFLGLKQVAPQQWQCQLNGRLKGSAHNFQVYGVDVWEGTGTLKCRTRTGEYAEPRTLDISFKSDSDGFGAGDLSIVELRILISTYQDPGDIQLRGLVNDIDGGPHVRYAMTSELSEARVYVISLTPEMASRSLKSGTMFVRAQSSESL